MHRTPDKVWLVNLKSARLGFLGVDRLSLTSLVYRSQAVPNDWIPDIVKNSAAVGVDSKVES